MSQPNPFKFHYREHPHSLRKNYYPDSIRAFPLHFTSIISIERVLLFCGRIFVDFNLYAQGDQSGVSTENKYH
jgi:hypothetical protein